MIKIIALAIIAALIRAIGTACSAGLLAMRIGHVTRSMFFW